MSVAPTTSPSPSIKRATSGFGDAGIRAALGWALLACLAAAIGGLLDHEARGLAAASAVVALCSTGAAIVWRMNADDDVLGRLALATWSAGAIAMTIIAGPGYAPWLAAPLGLAAAVGGRRWIGEAALITIGATVLAGLLATLGVLPEQRFSGGAVVWAGAIAGLAFIWANTSFALARQGADLRRVRRRLNRIADTLSEAPWVILRVGADGRVSEAFGAPRDRHSARPESRAMVGMRLADVFPTQAGVDIDRTFDQVLRHDHAARLDAQWENEPVRIHLRRLATGGVVAAIDLSRAHVFDQERQQASLDATQKRFFASVIHELRTPLNAIVGFSDMIDSQVFGPLHEKYAEYGGLIRQSAGHMLDLVGDLLDLAKIEAGRFELRRTRFRVADVLDQAANMAHGSAEAKGINLAVGPTDGIIAHADQRAVLQMLLNLVSNAVKFTPENGAVLVEGRAEDRALVLRVSDTGVGLSDEEIARLGQMFEQTESGKQSSTRGSGIGLALVNAFANLHGGTVHVDSARGAGARFTIRLPDAVVEGGQEFNQAESA